MSWYNTAYAHATAAEIVRSPKHGRSASSSSSQSWPSDGGASRKRKVAVNPFEKGISELDEDLRAYLFLFVATACVGTSAAACRRLSACVWTNMGFWRTYGGPCLFTEPTTTSASALRDKFRRWLFNLDGDWVKDLQAFVDAAKRNQFGANYVKLLEETRYIVTGLMPCDTVVALRDSSLGGSGGYGVPKDAIAVATSLDTFGGIIKKLLAGYDVVQLDERSAAEALVLKLEGRTNIFSDEQQRDVTAVYNESLERGIAAGATSVIHTSHDEPEMLFDPFDSEDELEDDAGVVTVPGREEDDELTGREAGAVSFWRTRD